MEKLEIEDNKLTPVKNGILISKKILYIAGVSFTVVLVGSILATYYGTVSSNESTFTATSTSTSTATSEPSVVTTNASPDTNITSAITTTPTSPQVTTNYRLTQDLKPFYYDIFIQPYFTVTQEPQNYSANVIIKFKCDVETNKLILHMKDLVLDNSTLNVKSLNDSSLNYKISSKWSYNKINHFFTAVLPQNFKVNHSYEFTANLTGFSTDDELGFYKSSYNDSNNQTRWLITSQMEYIEARKSFICFDEPIFKSKFKIKIQHDVSLHAMSNMPIQDTKYIGMQNGYNWTLTEFEETVQMSTYLVAILVSDFKCKSGISNSSYSSVDVKVCARPNAEDKLELALNSSVDILSFFEEFYKVKYPLKKLDHAGVPDFKYGAMENWGLAIYREIYFIFDDKSTQNTEINVVRIIAHEISHMWFGNLVTPKWWDDLWLNEGFARFAEHVGSDAVKKHWRMYDRLFDLLLNVIQSDSTEETRAVSTDVNTPEEIDANINPTITYGKGSAIVKMLSYILGDDTFRNGLKVYFETYEYQNVDQSDLWKIMDQQMKHENKSNGVNLLDVMTSWTKQKGHPVVTLKRINDTHISLEQNRFLVDSTVSRLNDTYWRIPISLSIEELGSVNQSFTNEVNSTNLFDKFIWLKNSKEKTIIPLNKTLNNNNFLIANLDMAVFCRINYDEKDWSLIAKQLLTNTQELSARTRAQLISDVFSLSQALYINSTIALNHIQYLEKELDYLPWSVFVDRVKYFTGQLDRTQVYYPLKKYLQKLVKPYYDKLGWIDNPQTDDWNDRVVRNKFVEFACQIELPDCLSKARSLYKDFVNSGIEINLPSQLRRVAFCSSIEQGNDADFETLFEKIKKIKSTSLKTDILYGLSCSKTISSLNKYLDYQIQSESTSSVITAIRNVLSKPSGFNEAWNFLKQNWEKTNGSDITGVFTDLGKRIRSKSDLNDIENFFNDKNLSQKDKDSLNVAKNQIKSNIKWFDESFDSIKNWLSNLNSGNEINYRLPKNLIPKSYEIIIKPYIGDSWKERSFTFDGSINISFTCAIPTNKIVFHAIDLNLHTDSFKIVSTENIKIEKRYTEDKITNFIEIDLDRECSKGSDYVLQMDYTGLIIENLYGFYRSSYKNENNGQTEYLATTHFQPTDARRAFPCFDEPALKASFKLTMIRHKSFSSSIFNTPLEKSTQTPDGEWFMDEFKETPKMSTYLVAFVVSNFVNITNTTLKGIEVEVWGRPEKMKNNEGDFSLREAQLILDFFEDYFYLDYPLDKSSQIGVPDFNAGAMENWGAVIYRETALFFNPATDALVNKQRVSSVVSHELAHQWFGNLVTPDWWNDIWLNEGFASWVEYLGVNHTHPEWKFLDLFYVQKLKVMELDSLESSHSVSFEVNDPGEINSLFDKISYDKGSSIIRMMNAFLTEETFRNGVSKYLKHFEYNNAKQDDLWEFLTNQSYIDGNLDKKLSVKDIMDTWTLKKGYPYVTVERDYGKKEMILTQNWFLLNPDSKIKNTEEYANYKWFIPFTYTSEENPVFDFETKPIWLEPHQKEFTEKTDTIGEKSWIIGNLKHSAFMRVNYDQQNWNLLIQQLKTDNTIIDPINRATLLDDSFNLGRAEIVDQLLFMNLSQYLKFEQDGLPFVPAFIGLDYIGNMIGNDYFAYNLYKDYMIDIMNSTYQRLGWDAVSDDLINLQISTLQLMCSFGFEDCVNEARSRFNDWFESNKPLPNDFKNIIYSTIGKFESEQTWFKLFEKAQSISDNTEKLRIFRGLASTKDASLLSIILKSASDINIIRSQDETSVIAYVAGNPLGRKLAFDHLEDNWDELFDRHGDVSFTLSSLVDSVTKYLNTNSYLQRLLNFVERNSNLGVATKAFEQAIENVQFNTRWTNKNLKPINEWLNSNK